MKNLTLNENTKKLLYFVAAVAIIFCAYYFGCRTISEKNAKLKTEIEALELRYSNLKDMLTKADDYAKDTVKYTDEIDEILAKYDSGCSQEYAISFLKQIETRIDSWIKSGNVEPTEVIYTFGQISSTNPYNTGATVYETDYKGISTTISTTYQGSYAQIKDMIEYINTYKYKCTIDNMTLKYDSGTETVSGNLTLTLYAVTGSDREFPGVTVSPMMYGTDNIFDSSTFDAGDVEDNTENGNDILNDYDYYISIQGIDTDEPIVIDARGDATGASKVVSSTNDTVKATITFTEEDGECYCKYTLDGVEYPAGSELGDIFIAGDTINLLIMSSERGDSDDCAVDLTIENDTEREIRVKVQNDDKSNSRISIGKANNLTIYE